MNELDKVLNKYIEVTNKLTKLIDDMTESRLDKFIKKIKKNNK